MKEALYYTVLGLMAKYPGDTRKVARKIIDFCQTLQLAHVFDGGARSGNFNHAGRPGLVGGSAPSKGTSGGQSYKQEGKGVKKKETFVNNESDFNYHVKRIWTDIKNNVNTDTVEKVFYRSVNTKEAQRLKKHTGLNLEGYRHEITNTDVLHIFKNHGNDKKEAFRGQRAVSEKDICLIPEITANYDDVLLDTEEAEDKPVLIYKKKIGDEFVYLETVSENKKELRPKTMYIIKEKKAQHAI